jgi:hypothetical protein
MGRTAVQSAAHNTFELGDFLFHSAACCRPLAVRAACRRRRFFSHLSSVCARASHCVVCILEAAQRQSAAAAVALRLAANCAAVSTVQSSQPTARSVRAAAARRQRAREIQEKAHSPASPAHGGGERKGKKEAHKRRRRAWCRSLSAASLWLARARPLKLTLPEFRAG